MGTHSEYLLPSLAILVIAVGCRWYLHPEYRDASIQLYNAEASVRFLSSQELEGKQ